MTKVSLKVDKLSLAKVTAAMNLVIGMQIKKSRSGLIASGVHILGKALTTTPVQYNILRSSGTVIWDKGEKTSPTSDFSQGPQGATERENTDRFISSVKDTLKSRPVTFDVGVGFGASYAVFVHEDMEASHKEGTGAMFLARAVAQERRKVVEIIKSYARV